MRVLPIVVLSILLGIVLGSISANRALGPRQSVDDIAAIRGIVPEIEDKFPKLKIDDAQYDFGSMQRGSSSAHVFKITNEGATPLVLSVASTTCKCTGCDIGDGVIRPGETQDVTLEWIAKSNPGTFRQTATLETNDPRSRRLELTVEGKVTTVSGLDPKEFFFVDLRPNQDVTNSVYLMSFEEQDLEIVSATLEKPDMQQRFSVDFSVADANELPDDSAKSGYRIDVKPKPGLPLGPIHDWVLVRTNQDTNNEMRIPIMGTVQGDIEIRGPNEWNSRIGAVILGDIQSDEGASIRMFLEVRGQHAPSTSFKVSEVDPPELEIEIGDPIVETDDFTKRILTLRVPKGLPPAIRNGSAIGEAGRVVLETTHPVNKEISFNVRYVISDFNVSN